MEDCLDGWRDSARQRNRIGARGQAQRAIGIRDGAPDRGNDIPGGGNLSIGRLCMGGEDTLGQWAIGFGNISRLRHLGPRIRCERVPGA